MILAGESWRGDAPPKAKARRSNRVGCAGKSMGYGAKAADLTATTHQILTKNWKALACNFVLGGLAEGVGWWMRSELLPGGGIEPLLIDDPVRIHEA